MFDSFLIRWVYWMVFGFMFILCCVCFKFIGILIIEIVLFICNFILIYKIMFYVGYNKDDLWIMFLEFQLMICLLVFFNDDMINDVVNDYKWYFVIQCDMLFWIKCEIDKNDCI